MKCMVGHETLYGYNIKDYKLLMVMVVAMLNVATILYLIEVSSVVSFSLSVVLLLLFFVHFVSSFTLVRCHSPWTWLCLPILPWSNVELNCNRMVINEIFHLQLFLLLCIHFGKGVNDRWRDRCNRTAFNVSLSLISWCKETDFW